MPRRDKRRYGRTARDVRRGGLGTRTPVVLPDIKDVDLWIRVNGSDVANSNSTQSLTDTDEREVVTFTRIIQLQAGDYFELMFAVNDLNVALNSFPADAVNPLTPSVTINVRQL